jgi:hypothetical protein
VCRAAAQIQHNAVRLLVVTDKDCAALTSLHGAKWCLLLDDFYTQMIRVAPGDHSPFPNLEAVRTWPNLLLFTFDDSSLLNETRPRIGLDEAAGWRLVTEGRFRDGQSALYRNSRSDADAAPPPTVARDGDCVTVENCRTWCVKMGESFAEK